MMSHDLPGDQRRTAVECSVPGGERRKGMGRRGTADTVDSAVKEIEYYTSRAICDYAMVSTTYVLECVS